MFLVPFSPYFDTFHVSSPCVYPPDVHSVHLLIFTLFLAWHSFLKKLISPFFARSSCFFLVAFFILCSYLCETPLVSLLLSVLSFLSFGRFQSYPFEQVLFLFSKQNIIFSHLPNCFFSEFPLGHHFFFFIFVFLNVRENVFFFFNFVC